MKDEPIILYSPLSPTECHARLASLVRLDLSASNYTLDPFANPVVGSVDAFSLRLRQRVSSSFAVLLDAQMLPHHSGTCISGTFLMPKFADQFIALWLCAATFLSVILAAAKQTLIPLALPVFGVLFMWMGHDSARDHARFLEKFLADNLQAKRDASHVA